MIPNITPQLKPDIQLITSRKWFELLVSMKYISNASIWCLFLTYYTQAYTIFLYLIPIVITNCIVIILLEWFQGDELVRGVLGNHIEANDKMKFLMLNTIWHLIPLLWLWYILQKDNVIEVFHPNFLGVFLASAIFCIIYFYFASNGNYYGNINYTTYMIIYLIILLSVCVSLFLYH